MSDAVESDVQNTEVNVTEEKVIRWVSLTPLTPLERDCATTVMLKILDGKCKMKDAEKVVMTWLYDAIRNEPGELFDQSMHDFISGARGVDLEEMRMAVYEQRLLAETRLSRPVMKRFKAMIRDKGLFD